MTEAQVEGAGPVLREPFLDALAQKLSEYTHVDRDRVLGDLRRSREPARTAAGVLLGNLDRFLERRSDPLLNQEARYPLLRRLREAREQVAGVLVEDLAQVAPSTADRPSGLMDDYRARAAGEAAFAKAVAVAHPVLLEAGEPVAVRAELGYRLDVISEPAGLPDGVTVRGPQLRDTLDRMAADASPYTRPAGWSPETFANGGMIRITRALEADAAGPGWTTLPSWQPQSLDASAVARQGIRGEWASAAAPGVVGDLRVAEFIPGIDTAPPPPRDAIDRAGDGLATRISELTGTSRTDVLNSLNAAGPGELAQWSEAARLLAPGLSEQGRDAVADTMRETFEQGLRDLPEINKIDDWGRVGSQAAGRAAEHARVLTDAGPAFVPGRSGAEQVVGQAGDGARPGRSGGPVQHKRPGQAL